MLFKFALPISQKMNSLYFSLKNLEIISSFNLGIIVTWNLPSSWAMALHITPAADIPSASL